MLGPRKQGPVKRLPRAQRFNGFVGSRPQLVEKGQKWGSLGSPAHPSPSCDSGVCYGSGPNFVHATQVCSKPPELRTFPQVFLCTQPHAPASKVTGLREVCQAAWVGMIEKILELPMASTCYCYSISDFPKHPACHGWRPVLVEQVILVFFGTVRIRPNQVVPWFP